MIIPKMDFMRDMILKVIDVTPDQKVIVSEFDGLGIDSGLFIKYQEGGQINFEHDGKITNCTRPVLEPLVTKGEFVISYPQNGQGTCPLYEVAQNYFLQKEASENLNYSEEEGFSVSQVVQSGLNSTYNYFVNNAASDNSSAAYNNRDEENNTSWQDTLKQYVEQYWPYALGITAGLVTIGYAIKWFKNSNREDQKDLSISRPLGTIDPKPVSCVAIQGKYIEVTNSLLAQKKLCLVQTNNDITEYYELLNRGREIQCLEKDGDIISTLGLLNTDKRNYFKNGYQIKPCLGIIKDGKEEYIDFTPVGKKDTKLCVEVPVGNKKVLAPDMVMIKFTDGGDVSYISPREYQNMYTLESVSRCRELKPTYNSTCEADNVVADSIPLLGNDQVNPVVE